jgi:hypothetical protein
MNTPANCVRRKTTGDLRPYGHAARLFAARRTDAGFTPCRTDGLACREPGKLPESPAKTQIRRSYGESRLIMSAAQRKLRAVLIMCTNFLPKSSEALSGAQTMGRRDFGRAKANGRRQRL